MQKQIWNLKLWIFRACKVQKDKQEFQVNVAHWDVFINFRKLLHNFTNTLIETKQVLYFLDQELPLKIVLHMAHYDTIQNISNKGLSFVKTPI